MRTPGLVCVAALALLGCGKAPEPDPEQLRPYAPPPEVAAEQTVQVRNSCPEAVVIAVSATLPGRSTPTMTLRSTQTQAVTVSQGERIWLRYDGAFAEERSAAPSGALEIGYQCNSIYSQRGGL
ncbi:MAG: hypothetical protein R6X02_35585 [Enhygromyxa sp.]